MFRKVSFWCVALLFCVGVFTSNSIATEGGSFSVFGFVEGSAKSHTNVAHVYMEKDPNDTPIISGNIGGQTGLDGNYYYFFFDVLGDFDWNWRIGDRAVMVIVEDSNSMAMNHIRYYAVASRIFDSQAVSYLNFPMGEANDKGACYMNLRPIPVPSVLSSWSENILTWHVPIEDSIDLSQKNVIAYNIWRSESGIGKSSFTKIASNVTTTSYSDTSAVSGVVYYYAIELVFLGNVNENVISANSNPAIISTQGTGTVIGKVTAKIGNNGMNIDSVIASIPETGQSFSTDGNGDYILGNIAPGTYTLRIEKASFASVTLNNVVVTADQTTNVPNTELVLIPAGPAGDFTGNGTLGLEDALGILQVLSDLR